MAYKLTEWVEDRNMRNVVMLSYCVYWDKQTAPPRIAPPGGQEYEAFKLLLQIVTAPIILECPVCRWPRAEGYHCHACGDTQEFPPPEKDPIAKLLTG